MKTLSARSATAKYCAVFLIFTAPMFATADQVLGWNNLGMHCMDSDYSVFSILPPYNTIEAQLIIGDKLVTNSVGYTITYEAMTDPAGSFNSTSRGKGNYFQFVSLIYGGVAVDQGLPVPGPNTFWMPGTNNVPQALQFESGFHWFTAYGVPLTPYDDADHKNPYPMMRLVARNNSGAPLATNEIVLPVSDEMDCRACHASGTQDAAKPAAGWVWSSNPERDFRLNILRRHDEHEFANHGSLYAAALAARGFNSQGLYRGVVADGKPVLCAVCHASEALGTASYSTIPPLTTSVHSFHGHVLDPDLLITLDNSVHRQACYRCHPGSATKCLRGAMGGAIASDGTMEMQCQSCHGNMSLVGSSSRTGWLMEPACQSCHTGTASQNNGQIRFTSCFEANGSVRVATNSTFATNPNTPGAGLSLYRFSAGHGGLQCSACHGSTHAEFPSTHRNDNVRNEKIQGHAGVMIECNACHTTVPNTVNGGPHGMHPVGQNWVSAHGDAIQSVPGGSAACQACHGLDFRGTVLSRVQTTRTLTANFDSGTVNFQLYRGAIIGCYNCHNGPGNDNLNSHTPPVANNVRTNTSCGRSVAMTLPITGAGAVPRIALQPANGSVGLSGLVAVYYPDAGFAGTNTFTFTAWDGTANSGLATGTVAVVQGGFGITATAYVPPDYPANWAVPFGVVATPSNIVAVPTFLWNFGDGGPTTTNQFPTHAYAVGGYIWSVISTVQGGAGQARATNRGVIFIDPPIAMAAGIPGTNGIGFSWPLSAADALLEYSPILGPGAAWTVCTNGVTVNGASFGVTIPKTGPAGFYRLRKL